MGARLTDLGWDLRAEPVAHRVTDRENGWGRQRENRARKTGRERGEERETQNQGDSRRPRWKKKKKTEKGLQAKRQKS